MSNRLADEPSPYLRQHADNPVEWWPWGDEAFAAARESDRPVLVSIGYSACHWCHVMAHESFEDQATADLMNRLFVNIKVDREERPDVDGVYMDAVQAITGQGGWPLTVFVTPDGKPFYGGTYFPDEARHGMPSFQQVLEAVDDHWRSHRDEAVAQAERLTEAVSRTVDLEAQSVPGVELLDVALRNLLDQHDREWGGFGRAPKFPQTMSHELLLRAHAHSGDPEILTTVVTSLDAMASGGMYDHLGGGFARYSVDAFWMVPHFEKMLYDQALLARLYLHAWQVTGEGRFRQVLAEIVRYVLRDLRHADGGIYSAEDADSEGEEGKFYVWRPEAIAEVLGDRAEVAMEWYGVTPQGNFEGSNILHRPVRGDLLRSPEVEAAREALFQAREERVRPGLDDKVLTEWNALMVSTLAEAGAAAEEPEWVEAAVRCAEFLLGNLRDPDGRWMRSWQAGDGERPAAARHRAYANDHAALVDAFTRLAEATGEARWIAEARSVADTLLEQFWDPDNGGLFTTAADAPDAPVVRQKDFLDNATPAANSTAAVALLRLGALTGEDRYREHAEAILGLFAPLAGSAPAAFAHLLAGLDLYRNGLTEIVVAGARPDLVRAVHHRYLPSAVLAWGEPYDSPLWDGREDARAYVCQNYACQLPASTAEELAGQLDA
jgi:uncharacterized protein YyaL (SSP411 family)